MLTLNRILVCCTIVILFSSCVSSFFLSWGSTQSKAKPSYSPVPLQQPLYQRRHLHAPYAADVGTNENVPVQAAQQVAMPAVPIQVPLQAAFLPSNIHNVQLVPCLCPIAEDYEYEPQLETVVVTQKPVKN